ncbi:hypothetical protein [Mycoplana rhizolycopersici]|uniref:Uncharacterized protein n=1 Tax=Mycoplana rhizolycopersici TaxID=2746702 RepID=A0ABX2QE75_9HYPH|nr:hypothetical protein [Rhizobium rhizolycopersici]NVP55646.1 hypothetical protein [Rhizobium rhizolycopersici]
MNTAESLIDTGANGSAVARNYAFILVGGIVFPLVIVAHFIARKRRKLTGFEQSQYVFQYRTTSIALLSLVVAVLIAVAMFIWMPPQAPQQHVQIIFAFLNSLVWLTMLWGAARCIRGLYLCGARRVIQNSKTFWIWPQ